MSLVFLCAAFVTPVQARSVRADDPPDYCAGIGVARDPERCFTLSEQLEYFVQWFVLEMGVKGSETIAQIAWIADRLAVGFFDLAVNSTLLLDIKDTLMTAAATIMPQILRDVVYGGKAGLFYIAISLAGVMMAIPLWTNGASLVKPERALVWGVFLFALFVGGTSSVTGYDLVGFVETLRVQIVKGILSSEVSVSELVTGRGSSTGTRPSISPTPGCFQMPSKTDITRNPTE